MATFLGRRPRGNPGRLRITRRGPSAAAQEEGGGDVPEWVPDGAYRYIDFTTTPVRVWDDGAEVALATVLGNSALLSITFDPEDIEAGVGLVGGAAALIGMDTVFNGNFTMLAEFDTEFVFEMAEGTFAVDLVARYSHASNTIHWTDSNSGEQVRKPSGSATEGAHKMAWAFDNEVGWASYDNTQMVYYLNAGVTTVALPLGTPVTDIAVNSGATIKRLTVWDMAQTELQVKALTG